MIEPNLPTGPTPLSGRESQVLDLASQGLTDKEIALEFGIGIRSVHRYWERLMAKLNARSRLHAYRIHTQLILGTTYEIGVFGTDFY